MARRERPILVVSNRLPITVQRGPRGLERRRSTGGLVSALEPVLEKRGGTWIGWPGLKLREDERVPAMDDPYRIVPLALSDSEVRRYYHNFSNRTLWPLFHSFPERVRSDRRDWETYEEVNARFAAAASELADEHELVWVHDYHLLRMPHHLRRERPDVRIAFFLHTPFPAFDLYRTLPWYREILRGLLASDLIGFHVDGYARNFLDCAERLLRVRVDHSSGLVGFGERTVQVGVFPLGIDFDRFEARALEVSRGEPIGEQLVLGIDRLDYTKGIPERIRAFERLLEQYPEHREKVVLLQLAVPSRDQVSEYQQLKRQIDELVGHVNGRFGTATWSPIRYLYRSVSQERLAALYRDADVALITPLRDGMNLVAKEFVASQVDRPGVLVLSRLAGAAETMHEAIHVNPYNLDDMVASLHRALTMDEDERRERLVGLRRRERKANVEAWVQAFLGAAYAASPALHPPTANDFEAWLGRFLGGHHLALFLDYDGTLSPIADHPSAAKLSATMRNAVRACAERTDTDVTLVSGRSLEDIRQIVDVRGLTYAANHGMEIDRPDGPGFRHEDLVHYQERTHELAQSLQEIEASGVWIEEKGATLTFHYRQADPTEHERFAHEARERIQAAGFQAWDAQCAVEARPPIGWDKGHAVLHILRERYGPAWSEHVRTIYAGDDRTDEDAFRVLSGLGITFRVGASDAPTEAARELANVDSVRALLEWLAHRPAPQ